MPCQKRTLQCFHSPIDGRRGREPPTIIIPNEMYWIQILQRFIKTAPPIWYTNMLLLCVVGSLLIENCWIGNRIMFCVNAFAWNMTCTNFHIVNAIHRLVSPIAISQREIRSNLIVNEIADDVQTYTRFHDIEFRIDWVRNFKIGRDRNRTWAPPQATQNCRQRTFNNQTDDSIKSNARR